MKLLCLFLLALLFFVSAQTVEPSVEKIDPACTLSCGAYWYCVFAGRKDCSKPQNCDCDEFAPPGVGKYEKDHMNLLKKTAVAKIDPACTLSCGAYWYCVFAGRKDCSKPQNCDCDEFAPPGVGKYEKDHMNLLKKTAVAKIDPACTLSCGAYWYCVFAGRKDCSKPQNCDCDEFAPPLS